MQSIYRRLYSLNFDASSKPLRAGCIPLFLHRFFSSSSSLSLWFLSFVTDFHYLHLPSRLYAHPFLYLILLGVAFALILSSSSFCLLLLLLYLLLSLSIFSLHGTRLSQNVLLSLEVRSEPVHVGLLALHRHVGIARQT